MKLLLSILGTLFGGAITALAKYLLGRKAAGDAVKAVNRQADAQAHESVVRDEVAQKVAIDREKNDADLDRARADAGTPGGVRKQSADVADAIADANSEVR